MQNKLLINIRQSNYVYQYNTLYLYQTLIYNLYV